jgi:hypothetical protein
MPHHTSPLSPTAPTDRVPGVYEGANLVNTEFLVDGL